MGECWPVRGANLSSAPCALRDAAAALESFLQSDSVPETGILRSYLVNVSSSLDELASKRAPTWMEVSRKRTLSDAERLEIGSGFGGSGMGEEANGLEKRGRSKGPEEDVIVEVGKGSHSKRKRGEGELPAEGGLRVVEVDGEKGPSSKRPRGEVVDGKAEGDATEALRSAMERSDLVEESGNIGKKKPHSKRKRGASEPHEREAVSSGPDERDAPFGENGSDAKKRRGAGDAGGVVDSDAANGTVKDESVSKKRKRVAGDSELGDQDNDHSKRKRGAAERAENGDENASLGKRKDVAVDSKREEKRRKEGEGSFREEDAAGDEFALKKRKGDGDVERDESAGGDGSPSKRRRGTVESPGNELDGPKRSRAKRKHSATDLETLENGGDHTKHLSRREYAESLDLSGEISPKVQNGKAREDSNGREFGIKSALKDEDPRVEDGTEIREKKRKKKRRES